jgi:hypothetical protein
MTVPHNKDVRSFAGEATAERCRMAAFLAMHRSAQESAIRRLAAIGHGDYAIAHATGWNVMEVRRVIGVR